MEAIYFSRTGDFDEQLPWINVMCISNNIIVDAENKHMSFLPCEQKLTFFNILIKSIYVCILIFSPKQNT